MIFVLGILLLFGIVLALGLRRTSRTADVLLTKDAPPSQIAPQSPPATVSFTITVTQENMGESLLASDATSVRTRKPDAKWIPSGQEVVVGGYTIKAGMIYVGTNLPGLSGRVDQDPALINPEVSVDRQNPDRLGSSMPYWPSYSTISAQARAAYLEWLAGGRSTPGVGISHVFLFFYGLERRVLEDARASEAVRAEFPLIAAEVRRLLGLYGSNGSFRGYAESFRALLEIQDPTKLLYLSEPPPTERRWELPLPLRIGLGQIARDGKAVPASWALALLGSSPAVSLRTSARRCQAEFEQLFKIRYGQKYGEGMVIRPLNTILRASYHAASASFAEERTIPVGDLPDVGGLSETVRELHELAEGCCTELEPYSRWLGRKGGSGSSLAAIALLPTELASSHRSEIVAEFERWLDECLGPNPQAVINASDLVTRWPCGEIGELRKQDAVLLAQFLEKRGLGLEPDVRFDGPVSQANDKAIIFRLGTDGSAVPTPQYTAATLLLHLAALVSAADGTISDSEEEQVERHLEMGLQLSGAEKARLRAHLRWLTLSRVGMAGLRKRLAALSPEHKSTLGPFLVSVAGADGHIGPEEVKALTRIYQLLGLNREMVYRHCHALAAEGAPPASEPVVMRPADHASSGFAIPNRPLQREEFALDMKRVEAKIAESAAVASMLGQIFVDEEAKEMPPAPPLDGPCVRGLDAAHTALLKELAARASWSRHDFESIAARHALLPDGALDRINEAALEACEEPVCEGEDLLTVNPGAVQELLA